MPNDTRRWEIDFLRGIAISLMVGYHFLYDLALVGLVDNYPVGGWWQLGIWLVASIFLALVGVSMWLRRQKPVTAFIRRGGQILGWGVAVSVVTYLFDPVTFVRFGILHLIGLAIILTAPLVKNLKTALITLTGVWFLWAGLWLTTGFQLDCSQCGSLPKAVEWLLLVIGFWPANWQTLDYYPLLPWWGVVVGGVIMGSIFYPAGKTWFKIIKPEFKFFDGVIFLGKNSLFIYLIHQPILFLIVLIAKLLL